MCVCVCVCVCLSAVLFVQSHAFVLTPQSLLHDLKSETRGNMEEVMVALVSTPAQFDCHEVMRAMKVSVPPSLSLGCLI